MLERVGRWEPWLFALSVLVWMWPVLSNDYFVTGDGPCHLYNSRLLNDFLTHNNLPFLERFYFLNGQPDPNWIFNLVTAPILYAFGPMVAERTFFVLYVLAFCYGFRYFLAKINSNARFLAYFGLLACYNKMLLTGFLNNAGSLALWFWVAGWWWQNRKAQGWRFLLKWVLLTLLLYSAHPMGLAYCAMTIACLWLGELLFETREEGIQKVLRMYGKQLTFWVLGALPVFVLLAHFFKRRTWQEETTGPDLMNMLNSIVHLSPLQVLHPDERHLSTALFVATIVFCLMTIALRWRQGQWLRTDGLLLLALFTFLLTLWPPSFFSGGLDMAPRMAIVPFLVLLMWCATAQFPSWAKATGIGAAWVLLLGFCSLRWPIHRAASAYATEVRACAPYIRDTSTMLVLNYDWSGIQMPPEQGPISQGVWLFNHVDCYLGTDKTLAISDNYEVNYGYFPIRDQPSTNFYIHAAVDGVTFDHRPPRASMAAYLKNTGRPIDYVLLLCYSQNHATHPFSQEILEELERDYVQVWGSDGGRVVLFQQKSPSSHR
jgi:hypothetical protein